MAPKKPERRIADLEDEVRQKDGRIAELKTELDEARTNPRVRA